MLPRRPPLRGLVPLLALFGAFAGAPAVVGDATAVFGGSGPAESHGWSAPLPGGEAALEVVHPFDPPAADWLAGHRGVDLTADAGTAILAPAAGSVSFAGPVAGRGVVVVAHDGGLRSSFEPVTAPVAVGTRVEPGDPVGSLAASGSHCAPSNCLHWGIRRGETYLDPMSFLDRGPIVLLPGPE